MEFDRAMIRLAGHGVEKDAMSRYHVEAQCKFFVNLIKAEH